jgi:hypothetical protein
MLTATELRAKAQSLRDIADLQMDAGAAEAYRMLARSYESMAVTREMSADGRKAILFENLDQERMGQLG